MAIEFRTIRADEREATLDLLGNWFGDRAFFARYFHHDPCFRDDLCFVAVDGGSIVATAQVFRKRVRIADAVFEVGGIGNVYTADAYRGRGLASRLLDDALAAMAQHGFDLSLLFASRLEFYARRGWTSHVRHLHFLARRPPRRRDVGRLAIRPFAVGDLPAVARLYDDYNLTRAGTTVRDESYWRGQLAYAGNPDERFLVAVDDGAVVAYGRRIDLYEVPLLMEHGCAPGRAAALATLIGGMLDELPDRAPGMLTHLATDQAVLDRLAEAGASAKRVEDFFWMWRVISPSRVAVKLGCAEAAVVGGVDWAEILPPESSVYWTADRF